MKIGHLVLPGEGNEIGETKRKRIACHAVDGKRPARQDVDQVLRIHRVFIPVIENGVGAGAGLEVEALRICPSSGPSSPAASGRPLFAVFLPRHAESTSPPSANTVALPSQPSTVRRSTVLCAMVGGWCGFTDCLDALWEGRFIRCAAMHAILETERNSKC